MFFGSGLSFKHLFKQSPKAVLFFIAIASPCLLEAEKLTRVKAYMHESGGKEVLNQHKKFHPRTFSFFPVELPDTEVNGEHFARVTAFEIRTQSDLYTASS